MQSLQNYHHFNMYVINLDNKPKRLAQIREDFKGALPAGFRIVRWNATRHQEGWKGCLLSHTALLKHLTTKEKSDLYIILEDDCRLLDLKPVFKQRLPKYLDYLRAHEGEWNLFIAGGIYPVPSRIVCRDPFIIECDWMVCSQFNIHSNKSAKSVIEYGSDPKKWEWSIDTFMAHSNRGKIWVPYPMLSDQYCLDSSISSNSYIDNIRNEFVKSIQTLDEFVQKQLESQPEKHIK